MATVGASLGRRYDRLFAAAYDPILAGAERAGLARARADLLAGARGRTLEIGAGTGANLDHLPATVTELLLVEPAPAMRERLERKVKERADRLPGTVTVMADSAAALAVEDGSVDTLISTLVLCSVPDPDAAVRELRRAIAADGTLLVLEHVAGRAWVRRAQRLIEPAWRPIARGCHLTRDTREALERGGFDTTQVRDWTLPGGGITGPALVGTARPR